MRLPSLLLTLVVLSILITYLYYWWVDRRARRRIQGLIGQVEEAYRSFLQQQTVLHASPSDLGAEAVAAIKEQAFTILRPSWEQLAQQLDRYQPLSAAFPAKPLHAPHFPALNAKIDAYVHPGSMGQPGKNQHPIQLQQALDSDIETRLLAWKAGDRLTW